MTRAENILQKFEEGLPSASVGTSLPFIHRHRAPLKSSWFDKNRGQMIELYGTKVSDASDDIEVFLNTIDTMIGTLYRYNESVSLETFQQMVKSARVEGIETLSFPKLWTVVKP